MSGISWIDILLRLLPEALIIILAGHGLSGKKINIKLYLVSSVLLALVTYVFKILPITPALPMLLTTITTVLILVLINKVKVVHAVISTVVCYVVAIVTEGINIFALEKLLQVNPEEIFHGSNPLIRNLYGLPSLIVFALIMIGFYFITRRIKTKKNVTNE